MKMRDLSPPLRVALTLLLFILSVPVSTSAAPENTGETTGLVRHIEALYTAGDISQAASILETVLPNCIEERGPEAAQQLLVLYGVVKHSANDARQALKAYESALDLRQTYMRNASHGFLKSNIGRALWQLGRYDDAVSRLREALEEGEHLAARTWNNLALALHFSGQEDAALEAYNRALELDPAFGQGEVYFNIGVTLKVLGRAEEAAQMYRKALELNPRHAEATLNLAALYHEFLVLDEAVPLYLSVLQEQAAAPKSKLMAALNLGVALTEQGNAVEAIQYFEMVLKMWDGEGDFDLMARANILLSRIVVNDWRFYDDEVSALIRDVTHRQLARSLPPSHLPFDTLLVECDKKYRLDVAVAHAQQYEASPKNFSPERSTSVDKLKVGYFSFDYNNHPTAHLAEALFHLHDRSAIETHAISFGNDDSSGFRERIVQAADDFHDIALMSHADSVDMLRNKLRIDILMDMQGFTRGGRPEIVSQKPAPLVVNYLVYPGTSGASFVDYIVADSTVIPPEHAPYFTEKLVFLPDCYQINHYAPHLGLEHIDSSTGHIRVLPKRGARPQELPTEGFVFCNFNKNDKLDPKTWEVWMSILRQVPKSVLWLLEPSRRRAPELMKQTLKSEAFSRGVDPDRILFAPRVSKEEHLSRHIHADLFLDTLLYGAHSTATDSLRSGLPVLTLLGDVMPNRVASSLLHSLNHTMMADILVAHNEDDYVNAAVLLGNKRHLTMALKHELQVLLTDGSRTPPLFDAERYTRNLERVMRAMWEVYQMNLSPMHTILL